MDTRSSRGDTPTWFDKGITAARALDPYGLDAHIRAPSADLLLDLFHLVTAAERYGLRPARAVRWRKQLLTTSHSPDLLTRCEHRLRGWLLHHVDVTAG